MFSFNKSLTISSAVATLFAICFFSCSKNSSSTPAASATARSYAGAGSDWRWTLNTDGTFSATESTTSSTISGTYSATSTGFTKLVVTDKTGAHAPAVNTVIPCAEITGFAFVCAPILDNENQLIGNMATGTCPTASYDANVISMQFNLSTVDMTQTTGGFNQGSSYDGDLFSTFHWDASTNSGNGVRHFVVAGFTELHPTTPAITGTCSNGIMTTTSFNAYLAPGGAFVKVTEATSPNLGNGIVAVPIATIGSVNNLNGNYFGFLYDGTQSTGSAAVSPVTGVVGSNQLVVTGVSGTDLTTANGSITGTANLTSVDTPTAGFIEGTVSGRNVICMAGTDVQSSGKNILFCLGQHPTTPAKPYMLVMTSK